MTNGNWGNIRGFNYQPGYAATGVEIWRGFQAEVWEREIARGKELFPGINTLRIWLSFDAFLISPDTVKHLEQALQAVDRNGMKAIVTLFNGWHSFPEFGGITPEHMSLFAGQQDLFGGYYAIYVDRVLQPHREDPRILCWDLCNEPFNCGERVNTGKWLEFIYEQVKMHSPSAPVGVSVTAWGDEVDEVLDISDVLLVHPYIVHPVGLPDYRALLDRLKDLADSEDIPLLVTECCWGSMFDEERASLIELQLEELSKRGIGFLAHLLNHTPVADGHRPEYGVISHAGYMAFIEADGSLRPHHGVFNSY